MHEYMTLIVREMGSALVWFRPQHIPFAYPALEPVKESCTRSQIPHGPCTASPEWFLHVLHPLVKETLLGLFSPISSIPGESTNVKTHSCRHIDPHCYNMLNTCFIIAQAAWLQLQEERTLCPCTSETPGFAYLYVC